MTSGIAIGVDGGASSLKWSVRALDGRLIHGQALGANLQALKWDEYVMRLDGVIGDALSGAGATSNELTALGLGLSGVDRPAERERLTRWVHGQYPNLKSLWIGNDALPALRQGAGKLAGIILIAGTGSICVGVAGDGTTIRAGGWGSVLGDEGSGFWIGMQALKALTRMHDGGIETPRMKDKICNQLDAAVVDLPPWVAGLKPDELKRRVAALAPLVLDCAKCGEAAARLIFEEAVKELSYLIKTVAARLNRIEEANERSVVCAGGLFEHPADLAGALARANPEVRIIRLSEPASLGALNLGLGT